MLNATEQRDRINSDFNVKPVLKLLFGKNNTTKNIVNAIGSNFGSPKAIRSGNYVRSQATALPSLNELRTTGLIKHRQSAQTIQRSSTLFMMALTSIKTDALSAL
ncbi:MAG: hypothetical protein AUJ72_03285 [Candidatus Omnitrophica bacterium CG1_02_46_14]|nr:MAG: hypothetical protein AUJ72_03285 [Candidatus Omnitrophica bacterium CG1_02_46_14]